MNKFYVYLHIKESDGTPFYIGKGSGKRSESKKGRSTWWKKTVDKHGFDIILLEEDLTEEESFQREKYWIDRIGRIDLGKGTLVNMTDGGDGTSGYVFSDDLKKQISDSLKGNIPWNKGVVGKQKHTDEYKQNMSKRLLKNHPLKGKKLSEEHRKNLSESLKGREVWNTGKKLSEEHIEKLRKSHTGYKHTEEQKRKIAESVSKNSPHKKLILDTSTGIYYESLKEASIAFNIKPMTLSERLRGIYKNPTSLIYV
jgi:group I intron endonuclease